MLQIIRDRAQGIFAWIIILLLIIPFALWGINTYFHDDSDRFVATVGGTKITLREFTSAFQRQRAFRQQMLQGRDASLLDDEAIKQETLDQLVDRLVLKQGATDAGFRIGIAQLADAIRKIPQFQQDGRFDKATYERTLRSIGQSESTFEDSTRGDLLVNQMASGITETALAPASEIDRLLKLKDQQRQIGYFIVPRGGFADTATVTDAEVEDYYNKHLDEFSIPEKVRIDYLELSAADLKQKVKPADDATLHQLYEERASDFVVGEERHVRHILIGVDQSAGADADAKARAQAEDLLKRIRAGESFEKLAKKYSTDPGSAVDGGDLGVFGRGVMVKPFEDAAFKLPVGQVSEPVRSPFGYHLIRVDAIEPGKGKSFAEVRTQLAKDYIDRQAEEQFYDLAERLVDLTYENPDTLTVASNELGLKINSSDFFDRESGTGVAAEVPIRNSAFSVDVLESGNNSEPIQLGENRIVVLRVKDRRPASHRALAEVHDEIVASLRHDAAQTRVEEAGAKMVERLRAGETPSALAAEHGVQWHAPEFVARQGSSIPSEIVNRGFAMGRPTADEVAFSGFALTGGGYAIVALSAVRDGDLAAIKEEERKAQEQGLLSAYGRRAAQGLLEGMKARADVRVLKTRL
jgi:peptidyl-prolyl cis-trans isomerase D